MKATDQIETAATSESTEASSAAAREARLAALVDQWTAHMRWRADFAAWRERRLWQERYQADRLRQLRNFCGPLVDKRVLDLGCGMGGLAVALRQAGARAVGLEPNRAYGAICQLRAARYGLTLPVVTATGEGLPFSDRSFDLVICLDVLEHAESLELTLAEIARVLAPGGQAIVTATNRFVFRDPHYHLRGINWLPRSLAEALIRRRGRGKDAAAFADRQALSAMHYVTYRRFAARCRALGFNVTDVREQRILTGQFAAHTRFARLIAPLRRLGLAQPAYRVYRAVFLGTFEVHLRKLRSAECGVRSANASEGVEA
ncbi:MAG: class I SAM-dependent methyltransferase [Thermomicrobiales bacterium]